LKYDYIFNNNINIYNSKFSDYLTSGSFDSNSTKIPTEFSEFSNKKSDFNIKISDILGEYSKNSIVNSKNSKLRFLTKHFKNNNIYSLFYNNLINLNTKNNLFQKINIQKMAGRFDEILNKIWDRYSLKIDKYNLLNYKFIESIERKKYLIMFYKNIDILKNKNDFDNYVNLKNNYINFYKKTIEKRINKQIIKKTLLNHINFLKLKIIKIENLINIKTKHLSEILNSKINNKIIEYFINELYHKQNILYKLKYKYN
jgi:hypothetical protein